VKWADPREGPIWERGGHADTGRGRQARIMKRTAHELYALGHRSGPGFDKLEACFRKDPFLGQGLQAALGGIVGA